MFLKISETSNDILDADIVYYQGLIDSYGLNSKKLRDTADIEADIKEMTEIWKQADEAINEALKLEKSDD